MPFLPPNQQRQGTEGTKKQLLGTYSITQVKYHKRDKLEKSTFSMLFLKTFKDVKFVADGTDIYYSINEKLLSNASCASRPKQFIVLYLITCLSM